ncbi:MAG: Nif3-like dinuclear metal center hexameric protein, partial [Bacteroidetes bacterium]
YESCSFRTNGTGTFRGLNGATPFIGDAGQLERVEEVRLEMLVEKWKISPVLNAMKTAHPYDEVAYDLYSLENRLGNAGAGTIGTLATPESLEKFLQRLRKRLHTGAFRFTGRRAATIRRVAVCGGSGSELIRTAIAAGADAYVTADIKYHTFQDAESNIALIDAGHFETESPIIPKLVSYFTKQLTGLGEQIPVFASTTMSNPVCYYS